MMNTTQEAHRPRVLCVGITVADLILSVEHLPSGDGKTYASDRQTVVGGIAANAALAISRLGGHAILLSSIGHDMAGEAIAEFLIQNGVDTSRLDWLNGVATSASAILVAQDGKRMLINHADPSLFRAAPDLSDLQADAVMTDTRWPKAAIAALQWARSHDVPGLVDFDSMPDRQSADQLLALASHIVFGAQGLVSFSNELDPGDALLKLSQMTDAWLAVTLGDQGVLYVDQGVIRQRKAYPIQAVDTLGAGDAFHGALALGLACRQPLSPCLDYACAVAALKCRRRGGGQGMPTHAEVEVFLREYAS